MSRTPRIFVVSGPSGVGKGTIVARIRDMRSDLGLTVSATTRAPREGEVEGESYFFMDDERFDRLIEEGAFFEWARVFDHRKGTLVSEVERCLAAGASVILEIDVQGGLSVKERAPEAVLVFVEPPSMAELERRLRGRGTDDDESIALRLSIAKREMELAERYDEHVVNDDLDICVGEVARIIDAYENCD